VPLAVRCWLPGAPVACFLPAALRGRVIPLSEFRLELGENYESGSLGGSLRRASRDDTWWGWGHPFHVPPLRGCVLSPRFAWAPSRAHTRVWMRVAARRPSVAGSAV
jgi:hypothetical protein